MSSLQAIIDRATDIAAGAVDGPLQDAAMLAQSLLPEVLHSETEKSALDPYKRSIYKRVLSVTITNNVGDLPDEALTAYACEATVTDENGDIASLLHYDNFVRSPDTRLAHFAIRQGTEIHYLPVGGGAYNDDIEVTIACVPEIPTAPTDEVVMPAEIVDDVVRALADKMVLAYKNAK